MARKTTSAPKKRTLVPFNYCSECETNSFVVKNGLRNGRQRYKCQECGNTFYEHGLVQSRTMMARQVIILTLLGKSKEVIAKQLNIGEKTVARHLNKYTNIEEFQKIIPLKYERIDEMHRTKKDEVVPIYKSWTEVPEKPRTYNLFARNDPRKKTVKVNKVKENKDRFMRLLLEGDEQEENIKKYLYTGDLFALYDGGIRAVCVVTKVKRNQCELKNIAVYSKYRGQKYGSALLKYILNHYQGKYKTMTVGIGDSPKLLDFFKLWRFKQTHIVENYFIDNYDHPIFVDGKQMKNKIYLENGLKGNEGW